MRLVEWRLSTQSPELQHWHAVFLYPEPSGNSLMHTVSLKMKSWVSTVFHAACIIHGSDTPGRIPLYTQQASVHSKYPSTGSGWVIVSVQVTVFLPSVTGGSDIGVEGRRLSPWIKTFSGMENCCGCLPDYLGITNTRTNADWLYLRWYTKERLDKPPR